MISIASLIALGAMQGGTPPIKPAPDAVVATVGGAPITAAEVDPYLWAWKSREVINELAGHRMIAAEAARKGIVASETEVQRRVADQLAKIKGSLREGQTLDSVLNGQLGGPSRLDLVARSSILVEKLAELEFKPDGYVRVATIVFRTNGDSTDALSKAIKAADGAYRSLQSGKPWEDVLRLYEKDGRIVGNGGLVGWKAYDAFPESVRAQFGALNLMGFTKPTQTPNGIQIFRLLAKGSTAKPAELSELKTQYVNGARQGVVDRLKGTMKVEIK